MTHYSTPLKMSKIDRSKPICPLLLILVRDMNAFISNIVLAFYVLLWIDPVRCPMTERLVDIHSYNEQHVNPNDFTHSALSIEGQFFH